MKALIFSVSIGAGHDSVANSIGQTIYKQAPESEVLIVDTFKYINSVLNKVVVESYMETIRFTPKVWGYLYDQAEDGERLIDLGQILSKLLSPKLDQLLKSFNPDILICSHAFPAGMLATLKKKKKIPPIVTVITDYTVHSFWIHPEIDGFYIPSADLAYPLLQAGISSDRIKPMGIPIREQFEEKISQKQVRENLGLKDETTVLVMGGGLGLGKIEEIVKLLLENSNFQIITITGKNERLKENLEKLGYNHRLMVLGFVDNIAEVMTASDMIISKPGGVTTAEILAVGIPLIIFAPLPGQEDRNTDYLLNKGVAIKIRKIEHIIPEILSLSHNKLKLRQIQEMAKLIGKPYASKHIVNSFWPLIGGKKDETN